MNGTLLVTFLRDKIDRTAVAAALDSNDQRPAVYYLCPLSTVRGIKQNGILPNAAAPADRTDLSGQKVQARRDFEVSLTNDRYDYRKSTIHNSVNFFWNPLNLTFRAFQRHAILRQAISKNPDDGIVCVLEVPVETIVDDPGCFWTISNGNLAGSRFTNFTPEFFTGVRLNEMGAPFFDWPTIVSVGGDLYDRGVNRKRSAEFIVRREQEPSIAVTSAPIPFEWIRRIIVPDDSVEILNEDQLQFLHSTGAEITRVGARGGIEVFLKRSELLRPEKGFVTNIVNRSRADNGIVDQINAAVRAVVAFEAKNPNLTPRIDNFLSPAVADGWHGSLHTARVMFWAAFLAQHVDAQLRETVTAAAIAGAAIHDTRRESDREDEIHGGRAVEAFADQVRAALGDSAATNSCLGAVRLHCLPDDACEQRDLVWMILKDADALDRGRFGIPNSAKGCRTEFFRLDVLKNGAPYNNIPWMAYYLAQMTRYTPTENSPCANLGMAIHDGIEAWKANRERL